jgi:hypothetical protein
MSTAAPKMEKSDPGGKIVAQKYETDLCGQYLQSLSEKELQGYHIAKSHLGSSFSLIKSHGFITWKSKNV